jgi:hypothetical protein
MTYPLTTTLSSSSSSSSAWEEMDEWGPEKVLQVYEPKYMILIRNERSVSD